MKRADDYRRVAQDGVGDFWISTVWIGLDHAFRFHPDEKDEPPLIFETMIHNNASHEWED
jgi:hypothetical protein